MDPFVVSAWGMAALIIILFQDPNVPQYILLRIIRLRQQTQALLLSYRLAASLALTRRSFRNDWLGRGLRSWELWSIRRNPAYREIFNNDHTSK